VWTKLDDIFVRDSESHEEADLCSREAYWDVEEEDGE
jgi:hypothetical protein